VSLISRVYSTFPHFGSNRFYINIALPNLLYPAYVLKHYQSLFAAALRIFGSWRNALLAAAIDVPNSPHDGRRGVLRALREGLQQHYGNDVPEKLKLHATYYFGSLQKAKAALKTDRRFRAGWNKTKIIAAIRKCTDRGSHSAMQQHDVTILRL
jgi:hypothetical protein